MHPILAQQWVECHVQDLFREAEAARFAHQVRASHRAAEAPQSRRARRGKRGVKRSANQPALV